MIHIPRGRPKGSTNAARNAFISGTTLEKNKTKRTIKPPKEINDDKIYCCVSCGKQFNKLKGNFRASQSPWFQGWGHLPFCLNCLQFFEEQYTEKLGSNDEAIKRMALRLDLYLNDSLLNSSRKINVGQSRISSYIANANLQQYAGRTYDNYMEECTLSTLYPEDLPNDSVLSENIQIEVVWSDGDIKNKNFVIQSVGFDCFDDINYSDENKKFLYNALADYLTDEVLEDQHKLQSAIAMVKTILQREHVDKLINSEIRKPTLNYSLIEQLGKIKSTFTTDINRTANENGIAAKTSGRSSKGSNTLTNITKEMIENNFDDAKINIVDVKMVEAYRVVAEQNSRALSSELNYQSDDYARLLSEQRTFVEELQDKITLLEEENRKYKIENKSMKAGDG